jgi:hypothetical protein
MGPWWHIVVKKNVAFITIVYFSNLSKFWTHLFTSSSRTYEFIIIHFPSFFLIMQTESQEEQDCELLRL